MSFRFVTSGPWVLVTLFAATLVFAQDDTKQPETKGIVVERLAEPTRNWAVAIGVNQYLDPKIPNLKYAVADARLFAEQLVKRCGYDADRVLLITDDQEKAHLRPLKINLDEQLPSWLENARPGDTMLVFFSGHGFLDERGQGFLAPQDCRINNLGLSGLRANNLRDMLNQCNATRKVLVLDCCHSGSSKSATAVGHSSQELGMAFQAAEGLVTLASSRKQQLSHEWEEKKHGLFTYYLVDGLAGNADFDGNGIVDVDELYRFTFDKVSITAQRELNARQTPVRIIGDDVVGVFPLAHVAATPTTTRPLNQEESTTSRKPPAELHDRPAGPRGSAIEAFEKTIQVTELGQWEDFYECFTPEGKRRLDSLLENPHLAELHHQPWFGQSRGGARLAAVMMHVPELGFRLKDAVRGWRVEGEEVTGGTAHVHLARSTGEGEHTAVWSFRFVENGWKAEIPEHVLAPLSEPLGAERMEPPGRFGRDERPRDERGSPAETFHAMITSAAESDWAAFYDCFSSQAHPVFDLILRNHPEAAPHRDQPWFRQSGGRERFAEVCGLAGGLRSELQVSLRGWRVIEEHVEDNVATLATERTMDGHPRVTTRRFYFERGGWKSEVLREMLAMAEPRFEPRPGPERPVRFSPTQVYEFMQDHVRRRDWGRLYDQFCAEVKELCEETIFAETGRDSPLRRLDPRDRFVVFISERPPLQESFAEEILRWNVRHERTEGTETQLQVFLLEEGRVHESSRIFVLEEGEWKAAFAPRPMMHRDQHEPELPPASPPR